MSTDIRDAFFNEIKLLAESDSRVFVLSCDQGALGFSDLTKTYPGRCFNVGITEQNVVDVASGLALAGMRPFIYGITNFISLRCFEQISVNLSAMKLPVIILASGGGLTYSADGPTHHSTQDIAAMRSLPNMCIYNPADAASAAFSIRAAFQSEQPSYIRLEKGVLPDLHLNRDLSQGTGEILPGTHVVIFSTGILAHSALKTAKLLADSGVSVRVVDVFRLKPLDHSRILSHCADMRAVISYEENFPSGGLGELVSHALSTNNLKLPHLHLSLPDEPCYQYGSREWLHSQFKLDPENAASRIGTWLKSL